VLIFEPEAAAWDRVDALLRAARARAEAAGWQCWAYRNELKGDEVTLFLEGPRSPSGEERPIFDTEISELRSLARRFESVRSLVEYPLEDVGT
jgi:hypothetical protein